MSDEKASDWKMAANDDTDRVDAWAGVIASLGIPVDWLGVDYGCTADEARRIARGREGKDG